MESVGVKHNDLINLSDKKGIHFDEFDNFRAFEIIVINIHFEYVVGLPFDDLETTFIRFVRDSLLGLCAKHHLIAFHGVINAVFEQRNERFQVN